MAPACSRTTCSPLPRRPPGNVRRGQVRDRRALSGAPRDTERPTVNLWTRASSPSPRSTRAARSIAARRAPPCGARARRRGGRGEAARRRAEQRAAGRLRRREAAGRRRRQRRRGGRRGGGGPRLRVHRCVVVPLVGARRLRELLDAGGSEGDALGGGAAARRCSPRLASKRARARAAVARGEAEAGAGRRAAAHGGGGGAQRVAGVGGGERRRVGRPLSRGVLRPEGALRRRID